MPLIIKTVVVHGATGQQGGSVVRALAAAGYQVRAAVRDRNADKAHSLAKINGVSLVEVNLTDVNSLVAAYTGADAVYACTVPGPDELSHGKNMAEAAKKAGVGLYIWSALEPVAKLTNGECKVQFYDDKAAVGEYLDAIGVPHVNLFLGGFMENLVNYPHELEYEEQTKTIKLMYGGYKTDLKAPLLRVTKDVGQAVKIIFEHSDDFLTKKKIGLGNLWMTPIEMAQVVQKVTKRETRAVYDPHWLENVPGMADMNKFLIDPRFGMFKSSGMTVPDPLLEHYGFVPASFEEFVTEVLVPFLKL
ncbi:NAD(P)-binding protein [Exidia glandulosa HHB12029]|uniref:NAD(P)-binding protein n=1 Tax=Exidia glandulosa HHB12029 TaxID=1314781 RepID=A0A165DTF1_EXIGL|nr:NAD(P)-binding protein [Exidia glandulosa HHB12029]